MHATPWLRGHPVSPGRRFAPLAPVLGLALSLAVLAGCGSVAAPGSASSGNGGSAASGGSAGSPVAQASAATSAASSKAAAAQAALCTGVSRVDKLVIVRTRSMNKIQVLHFPFPPTLVVTSAPAARSVARAVCALPAAQPGVVNCPALLLGTSYHLTFTAAGKDLPVVTAQATGCQTVTGAGPVRQAAAGSGFWQVLGRAMGLFSPGPPVFRGNGPAAAKCQAAMLRLRVVSGCPATSQLGSGFRK